MSSGGNFVFVGPATFGSGGGGGGSAPVHYKAEVDQALALTQNVQTPVISKTITPTVHPGICIESLFSYNGTFAGGGGGQGLTLVARVGGTILHLPTGQFDTTDQWRFTAFGVGTINRNQQQYYMACAQVVLDVPVLVEILATALFGNFSANDRNLKITEANLVQFDIIGEE